MDYKEMVEAIEGKLNAELRIYKNILADYQKRELPAHYIDGCIDRTEGAIKFIEELKRIKEALCTA